MICNRCLYKTSIVRFDLNRYSSLVKELLHLVSSYDGRLYICRACHNKVKKINIPCQTVSNKLVVQLLPNKFRNLRRLVVELLPNEFRNLRRLVVELLPNEFRNLRRLERILVEMRILFKKVSYAERSVAKSEG